MDKEIKTVRQVKTEWMKYDSFTKVKMKYDSSSTAPRLIFP